MRVDVAHWLEGVLHRSSPNCDARPDAEDVSLVVVHGISLPPGRFATGLVDDLFLARLDCSRDPALADLDGVRVSAHVFVDRMGVVTQYVPFHLRAWHAGTSRYAGRDRCNDFSIGIELEGTDDVPYEDAQYHSLVAVAGALLVAYPRLTPRAWVGHSDVAPGRKTDPGPAFDWRRFFASLDAMVKA